MQDSSDIMVKMLL